MVPNIRSAGAGAEGGKGRSMLRPYALPGIMRPLAQALPLPHPVGGTRGAQPPLWQGTPPTLAMAFGRMLRALEVKGALDAQRAISPAPVSSRSVDGMPVLRERGR